MYEAFAAYCREQEVFRVSHSRIARYEILMDFLRTCAPQSRLEEYAEWLTLDLYLRDNVKNRPDFLGESRVNSDEAAAFYKREEAERRYLKEYEGYDRRQMRKMTHLERLRGRLFLFDYRKRDALTGDAALY